MQDEMFLHQKYVHQSLIKQLDLLHVDIIHQEISEKISYLRLNLANKKQNNSKNLPQSSSRKQHQINSLIQEFHPRIENLSDTQFGPDKLDILNKGLKYDQDRIPTPRPSSLLPSTLN